MKRSTWLFAAAVLGMPGAASAQAGGVQASARRIGAELADSAGVPVVVNPARLPSAVAQWRLGEQPQVVIGAVRTVPGDLLIAVRGGVVLSDGQIVLADDGNQQIRFFDASGRHLRTVGGLGREAGEFQRVQLIGAFRGDSLLAVDYTQRTLSVFGPDGRFGRAYQIPVELAAGASVIGVLSNGSAVLRRPWPLAWAPEAAAGSAIARRGVMIDMLSPGGLPGIMLGEFPGLEQTVDPGPQAIPTAVFGRNAFHHAAGDRIAIGTSDAFSVRVYGEDGQIRGVVRQNAPAAPIAASDIDRLRERMLEEPLSDSERKELTDALADAPRPATRPAFGAVRIDRTGNLWVQDYAQPGDAPAEWQVFDADGVLLSRVPMPNLEGIAQGTSYFTILDVGPDYVLGRIQDEQPLERVVLYRLLR
jgi:hypothetical protein